MDLPAECEKAMRPLVPSPSEEIRRGPRPCENAPASGTIVACKGVFCLLLPIGLTAFVVVDPKRDIPSFVVGIAVIFFAHFFLLRGIF